MTSATFFTPTKSSPQLDLTASRNPHPTMESSSGICKYHGTTFHAGFDEVSRRDPPFDHRRSSVVSPNFPEVLPSPNLLGPPRYHTELPSFAPIPPGTLPDRPPNLLPGPPAGRRGSAVPLREVVILYRAPVSPLVNGHLR